MNNSEIKFSISTKHQIIFAKRLHYLLDAGLGLKESVFILHEQSQAKSQKMFLKQVYDDISLGKDLSESLQIHIKNISPLSYALIKIGEESGTLSQNIHELAKELSKKQALINKIISALMYPVFIALATCVLSLFLIIYIFPKITPLFASLSVPLPLTTRILIYISNLFSHHWLFISITSVSLTISSIVIIRRNIKVQKKIQELIITIPFIKKIIIFYFNAVILRYVYILLQGGLSIDSAIDFTLKLITFSPYKNALSNILVHIINGDKLSENLLNYPHLFPKFTFEMISLGESIGTLPENCRNIVELYEQEIDDVTKAMTSILEPALMLGMGVVVGTIALSIITPLYAITQNIHH